MPNRFRWRRLPPEPKKPRSLLLLWDGSVVTRGEALREANSWVARFSPGTVVGPIDGYKWSNKDVTIPFDTIHILGVGDTLVLEVPD